VPGGALQAPRAFGIVVTSNLLETPVFISSAYAQAAAGGDTQSTLLGMLPLVLMFVVLYFVMIRPQMKRQKEHKAMVSALAKGDEVVTAGGFLGKVSKIGEIYVGVELADGMEVQMQRTAVVQVLPKGTIKSV
jgi:preprotein translocase subunit YajC